MDLCESRKMWVLRRHTALAHVAIKQINQKLDSAQKYSLPNFSRMDENHTPCYTVNTSGYRYKRVIYNYSTTIIIMVRASVHHIDGGPMDWFYWLYPPTLVCTVHLRLFVGTAVVDLILDVSTKTSVVFQ